MNDPAANPRRRRRRSDENGAKRWALRVIWGGGERGEAGLSVVRLRRSVEKSAVRPKPPTGVFMSAPQA